MINTKRSHRPIKPHMEHYTITGALLGPLFPCPSTTMQDDPHPTLPQHQLGGDEDYGHPPIAAGLVGKSMDKWVPVVPELEGR